uniref:Sorting nexin family member 30 n=1 Tax=Salmo trutta TaxID=8032 RepID=A0A673Z9L5_SALTR
MSVGTPKSLASSGQKPIQEICHPLGAEEAVLTPSPDVRNITSSIGEKDPSLPNGTPVETSSPSSSSSLLNRLQLDDDLDVETRDLFVTVDDPKKHVSTMETYITYRVVTKTTRVEFDLPEYSVRRRYQDFDWLRTSWRIVNGESVKYVTGGYKLRSRPMEFAAMGDYLDMFTQKLGTIDRIAQRIIKEQSELREYGPVYTWAASEAELQGPLEAWPAAWLNCSSALDETHPGNERRFLPVLREYVLYIESMKAVLKKRDNVHAEYEAKLEAASLRKEERPTAKVPTDVEKCQDRVECFNADLKSDWDQWQNNKTQDFRQLLTGMADHNIQYYEKVRGPTTTSRTMRR